MISPHQLEILQHAMGLDKYGRCAAHEDVLQCRNHGTLPGHRNHFCAGGECVSTPHLPCSKNCDACACRELVALGLMRQHATTATYPYYNCSVTEEGRKAIREQSPPAPKLSKSQKNYRAFLSADTGMTFGEWLKRPKRENSWEGWY